MSRAVFFRRALLAGLGSVALTVLAAWIVEGTAFRFLGYPVAVAAAAWCGPVAAYRLARDARAFWFFAALLLPVAGVVLTFLAVSDEIVRSDLKAGRTVACTYLDHQRAAKGRRAASRLSCAGRPAVVRGTREYPPGREVPVRFGASGRVAPRFADGFRADARPLRGLGGIGLLLVLGVPLVSAGLAARRLSRPDVAAALRDLRRIAADVDRSAARLGLAPGDLGAAAARWRHAPLVTAGRLGTSRVLICRTGEFRGRPVIVAVRHEPLDSARRPVRARCLLVTAVRLDVPADAAAAVAGGDPALAPDFAAGRDVPAPGAWTLRANNVPLAARLAEALPPEPFAWRTDDVDVVRLDRVDQDDPVAEDAVEQRLESLHRIAAEFERLTVLGFGDRPYTPAWPPDSPVRERFPSDVVAELKAAGWEPGRRSAADLPDAPDAVRAFVGEFGGLTVPTRGTGPLRRVGFTLDPEAVPDGEACDALAARIGRAVYPLGVMADDSHLLAIDSSARVFGLGRAHDVLLGHLPDEAVIKLVRGILTPAIGGRTGSYRAD